MQISVLAIFLSASAVSGFSVAPSARPLAVRLAPAAPCAVAPIRAASTRVCLPSTVMKIGRPEDEPDEAFISTWEQKPDSEKIKSPAVLIGLGAIILPFIIGIIVLASGGFGNN